MRFLLAASTLFLAASASAATIVSSATSPTMTDPVHQVLGLGRFDASLGTLTGATLSLTEQISLDLRITNTSSAVSLTNQTFSWQFTTTWSSTTNALDALLPPPDVASGSATPAILGPQVSTTRAFTVNGSHDVDLGSILGALQGAGSFDVICDGAGTTTVSSTASAFATATEQAHVTCGASIRYTYTPGGPPVVVPEPGSLLLLALSGIGVLTTRRRTRSR